MLSQEQQFPTQRPNMINGFTSSLHPVIMIKQAGGAAFVATTYGAYDSSREIEWQTQIASTMFLVYPRSPQAQSFLRTT